MFMMKRFMEEGILAQREAVICRAQPLTPGPSGVVCGTTNARRRGLSTEHRTARICGPGLRGSWGRGGGGARSVVRGVVAQVWARDGGRIGA